MSGALVPRRPLREARSPVTEQFPSAGTLPSEKVHFKVSISSDPARGESPKFNLISQEFNVT